MACFRLELLQGIGSLRHIYILPMILGLTSTKRTRKDAWHHTKSRSRFRDSDLRPLIFRLQPAVLHTLLVQVLRH